MVALDPLAGRALAIGLAYMLDMLFGDPPDRFHPVAWLGSFIRLAERSLRRHRCFDGRFGGVCLVILTCVPVGAVAFALSALAWSITPIAGLSVDTGLIWLALSVRSLAGEGGSVAVLLEGGNLSGARRHVSRIVGRRTDVLDEHGVARAAIESLGENLVDGVLAPLLWAAVLGPAGAWFHKSASTLDSMVGYRTERYAEFGYASAKLDDLLAWVPARLALLLIPLAAMMVGCDMRGSWRVGIRDRLNHESPNSGHGEAAFAGALGVRLGGSVSYDHGVHELPIIGAEGALADTRAVRGAVRLVVASGAVSAVSAVLILAVVTAVPT